MRKGSVCGRVLHCVLALASAAFFLHSASGEESPYATGGEVTILQRGNALTAYIHVFTNTDEAATFASTGLKDLNVRYLVVGAGGAGGSRIYVGTQNGGGGGGGGGVCEKGDIPFAIGSSWQIVVGKGAERYRSATNPGTAAGASSISNGVADVETVPGGGNAGVRTASAVYIEPTRGAAGGGAQTTGDNSHDGAAGTYTSSLFGVEYGGPFAGGASTKRQGGGGGGAGGAGGDAGTSSSTALSGPATGGEGLASDITGETLVYGSGGGAGECLFKSGSTTYWYQGCDGGMRAGDGAKYEIVTTDDDGTKVTNYIEATAPVANSGGGGGGGGLGGKSDGSINRYGTDGADGIVVIRYDIYDSPCEGGDIVTKKVEGPVTTWVHQFTTAASRVRSERELLNLTGHGLSVRYLVVGAGGAGGAYAPPGQVNGGGGGGGGGGVCEKGGVPFAAGDSWQIVVGAGGVASVSNTMAKSCGGTSAISNGVADVETVPGGGGGASAKPTTTAACGYAAQNGASGGGASLGYKTQGGNGTYTNSIFGVEYGPFNGGKNNSSSYPGSGGGGASESGQDKSNSNSPIGGEGLVSDITGEPLVYGSGGGGGFGVRTTTSGTAKVGTLQAGGVGGTRGGIGAMYEIVTTGDDGTKVTNYIAAVAPAANSGGGGGGGSRSYSPTVVVYAPTRGADGIVVISYKTYYDGACPCAGGDAVTRTLVRGTRYTYRHYFTNARMADLFVNKTGQKLNLRYLVVGGGGAGGNSSTASGGGSNTSSGGGGGGGGVCETNGVPFDADGEWLVRVGAGAKKVVSKTDTGTVAGASSISNGTEEVALVPGGGNGAKASTAEASVVPATAGAAGGGGTTYTTTPGAGTYASSIFGVVPAGAPFAGGDGGGYTGAGGGGAAAAGTKYTTSQAGCGGEGLASDITGEMLVYGSGGGGGANTYRNRIGGQGGTRAGNGATYETTDEGTTFYPATVPAANSGCGGAGGMQDGNCNAATDGADGIVVISYDYDATPPGFLMLFK